MKVLALSSTKDFQVSICHRSLSYDAIGVLRYE